MTTDKRFYYILGTCPNIGNGRDHSEFTTTKYSPSTETLDELNGDQRRLRALVENVLDLTSMCICGTHFKFEAKTEP